MGRTLALLCVVVVLFSSCLGQESDTSTDSSASIDSGSVDWDSASSPLTSSNADAQAQDGQPSPRSNQDYETIFSNPWGPMLMQMNMPPYGDRMYNPRSRYEAKDVLDVNPYLRRPDAYYPIDWNDTTPQDYGRYPMLPNYQPYPPPEVFYPQQGSDRNPKNIENPDEFDSAPDQPETESSDESKPPTDPENSQPPPFYRPPFSRPYANRDQQFFYYPPMDYFWQNPRNNARGQGNSVPPTSYPYPSGFYPPGGPPSYPQVNVFVQPPTSEDKSGSSAPENIAERRQSPPEPVSPSVPSPNNFPTGVPPLPFQPNLPYPPNPYLFGYPPAGFRPPFVPGLLPPRPTTVLPNIPPPPPNANNLVDIATPDLLPPSPPKRIDLPPVPPPKTVPEVVNVDVIDPPKPAEGNTPYKFGYDMNDGLGTDQHREESADGSGTVTGSYSYRDLNGVYRVVTYIADKDGFRASVKTNEPGAANPGSADVVVFAERPPLKTVVEGLRRSDVDVPVPGDQSEIEVEEK